MRQSMTTTTPRQGETTVSQDLVRLPRRFWNDRRDRELPMPKAIAWSKTHVCVSPTDPVLADYLDDAKYYADIVRMSGDRDLTGLQASARATVKALTA